MPHEERLLKTNKTIIKQQKSAKGSKKEEIQTFDNMKNKNIFKSELRYMFMVIILDTKKRIQNQRYQIRPFPVDTLI